MRTRRCYFYDICSRFHFGKYKKQLLCDVIAGDPQYIYWCINTIPNFAFNETVISQIQELFPNFIIPKCFEEHIGDFEEFNDDYEFDDDYETDEDYEEDSEFYDIYNKYLARNRPDPHYRYNDSWTQDENSTYERYNGSWAQDEMGYSDDDIDTIFDGEPDAYWNID